MIPSNITFGRRKQFDRRSRQYPIRALLGAPRPLRSYTWRCINWLDQGREGACVGFAWAHELVARPVVVMSMTASDATRIYKKAQTLDPWPGEDYEGTSVLAGVKAIQSQWPKLIPEYRWAFGLDDVLETLSYRGPMVLGVNWYEHMARPDVNNIIWPTGKLLGGHAILANGIDVKRRLVRLHNSWGRGWGLGGDCFISFENLGLLLQRGGEACIPVRRGK